MRAADAPPWPLAQSSTVDSPVRGATQRPNRRWRTAERAVAQNLRVRAHLAASEAGARTVRGWRYISAL